ncbi:MAG: 16S rRNA (guanine(527)-N(7))-methyltransferase RsmG [Candidatus Cloacimonadaceae bacterium]
MTPKDRFRLFLEQHFPDKTEILMIGFENYLNLLYETNQQVNLVSRQMTKENYWLYHFLDSLLIINCMDLCSEKILDFGSGGGLPGIPLKLVFPDLKMTLLDSVGKKVRCLEQMILSLELTNCRAVWSRLEDFSKPAQIEKYDLIFCRSVKLESGFIEPLHKLLKPGGKVVFYKAQSMEDVSVLPEIEICDVSLPEIGKRRIVTAPRQSLGINMKTKKVG